MFSTKSVLTHLHPVLCHLLNDTSQAAVPVEPHLIQPEIQKHNDKKGHFLAHINLI